MKMTEAQVTEKLPPTPSVDVVDGNASKIKLQDYFSSADLPDENDDLLLQKQRKSYLSYVKWIVYVSIALSWCFGALGFSVLWILGLIVVLHGGCSDGLNQLIENCITYEKRQLQRKRIVNCDETTEWLNFLLNRWWLYNRTPFFTWLKSNADPLLQEFKPSILESITLTTLRIGRNTPFITSIRSFDLNRKKSSTTAMSTETSSSSSPGLIRHHLMMEADVGITCPEFQLILTGRKHGMEMNFMIERLNVSGKVHIIGQFGLDAPFPYIHNLSFKFVETPKVEFDVTALGTTNILGIKGIVHSLVMDALTNTVVDPYEWILNINVNDCLLPEAERHCSLSSAIIRVTVGWMKSAGKHSSTTKHEEDRWCVLMVGTQSYKTCRSSVSSLQWSDQHSFLIESLSDRLIIKVKTKKLISLGSTTLAKFDEQIDHFLPEGTLIHEGQLQKKDICLKLKLEYLQLPQLKRRPTSQLLMTRPQTPNSKTRELVEVDAPLPKMRDEKPEDTSVEGVLYICIHSAEGLSSPSLKSLPNPYCAIFHGSNKIKTTHYLSQSTNPKWDSEIELLVTDYTQTNVTIAVYNWNTHKVTDAVMLGSATIKSLAVGERAREEFDVPLEAPLDASGASSNHRAGTIKVTVIFRPMPFTTLQVSQENDVTNKSSYDEGSESNSIGGSSISYTSKPVVSNVLEFHGDSTGLGLMEVVILRAKNLLAKDLNGFSDPFCEIRINDEYYCKTTVKKKTLSPCWDEKLTIRLPRNGDTFSVVVWDDDTFGKDFLGSISFKIEDVRRLALEDSSHWFVLKETKSGEIELKFRILGETVENSDISVHSSKASSVSAKHSPLLDVFKSRPNFYGEDVVDAIPFTHETNGHSDPPPIPDLPPKTKYNAQGSSSPALSLARSGSSASKRNGSESPHRSIRSGSLAGTSTFTPPLPSPSIQNKYDYIKHKQSPSKSKAPTLTAVPIPIPPERKSSLPTPSSPIPPETVSPTNGISPTEIEPSPLSRGSPAYSSFHEMKRKMKKTFSQPLRRFRSEANVQEDKSKNFKDRVTVKAHDDVYKSCSNIEKLASELNSSPTDDQSDSPSIAVTSTDAAKQLRYFNIRGTVVQATGIELPQESQICCRVRLLPRYYSFDLLSIQKLNNLLWYNFIFLALNK
ncbi:hypothetical protein CHUAL_006561 [Chamberlinius hualienensis]